jgi:hypothetical protein
MATNAPTPYIPQNPGDLISAENWNQVQVDVKQDIAAQIQTAVGNIKSVDHATNADQLDGQTADQLTQSILKQAEEILPERTGYFRSFNKLQAATPPAPPQEKILKHGLKSFPLVDVYQLDYFPAICSGGENDNTPRWVNFFLYHTSERTLTVKGATPATSPKAVIEAPNEQPFRVLFSDMLALYQVQYTDTTTLDELETAFWTAFWVAPNDEFDSDQYCHSPWFEKCCGEKRTVKTLKDGGAWKDIWFKMVPRKTINYPTPASAAPVQTDPNIPFDGSVAPTQIQVVHHDFDTVGIKLLMDPIYPQPFMEGAFQLPANPKQLKVMVLMKV